MRHELLVGVLLSALLVLLGLIILSLEPVTTDAVRRDLINDGLLAVFAEHSRGVELRVALNEGTDFRIGRQRRCIEDQAHYAL